MLFIGYYEIRPIIYQGRYGVNILAVSENGVIVQIGGDIETIGFDDINENHNLVSSSKSFRLGVAVANYQSIKAANIMDQRGQTFGFFS